MEKYKVFGTYIAAVILVFLTWTGLDYLAWFGLEGVFRELGIRTIYRDITEALRQGGASPLDHVFGVFIVSGVFVAIYQWFISPKKVFVCVIYGLLFGIVAKIDEGSLAYTYSSITDPMMLVRIAVAATQGMIAGLVMSMVIRS
ncbi:hypothetical protein [Psychromonas antarctica]|uniref:hypothetical protein n=1 Tax=Psychromonas antarctica TaxID=67573 RepID=UPI001EE93192|nr:hypothetical protein [Psychromonas antarctica]MCG6202747.1 hypothetical protein [Psychromonas antarctica]